MTQRARIFMNGRSQAVRLPAEFRFDTSEVFIRRDLRTGEVILSPKPGDWQSFFELADSQRLPADFMDDRSDLPPENREFL